MDSVTLTEHHQIGYTIRIEGWIPRSDFEELMSERNIYFERLTIDNQGTPDESGVYFIPMEEEEKLELEDIPESHYIKFLAFGGRYELTNCSQSFYDMAKALERLANKFSGGV